MQPYVDQAAYYVNELQARQLKLSKNKRRTKHIDEIDEVTRDLMIVLKDANNLSCHQHIVDLCKRVYDNKYNSTTTRYLVSIGLEY